MRKFRDRNGREWSIDLTIGTVARVRKQSGKRFDLLDPSSVVDGEKLSTVLDEDLAAVYEVLWYIIEPQAVAAGLNAEQFGESMAADCIIAAQAALFAEWLDFFRDVQRPDLATALDMMTTARRVRTANSHERTRFGEGHRRGTARGRCVCRSSSRRLTACRCCGRSSASEPFATIGVRSSRQAQ